MKGRFNHEQSGLMLVYGIFGRFLAGVALFLACPANAVSEEIILAEANLGMVVPDNNSSGLARSLVLSDVVPWEQGYTLAISLNLMPVLPGAFTGDYYAYLSHGTADGASYNVAVLLNRPGRTITMPAGYSDAGFDIILDDAAEHDVHHYRMHVPLDGMGRIQSDPPSKGILSGRWQPDARSADPFSVLDTSQRDAPLAPLGFVDPNGTWTLFIADLSAGGEATLDSWSLTLTPIPKVSTPSVVLAAINNGDVMSTAAILGGEVSSDGGGAITERGVVYAPTATNPIPEISGAGVTKLIAPGPDAVFTVNAAELTPGTAYSFRAYAENAAGVGYSEVGTFTTPIAEPLFAGFAASTMAGKLLSIYPEKILARTSDPDGGAVMLIRVFGPSVHGGTVSLTDTVNYTPAASFTGTDSFDVEFVGSLGGTLRASIVVTVIDNLSVGRNLTELRLRDGMVDLTFRGVPGRSYIIQRSTDLASWTTIARVTAAADGRIDFTDDSPPQPSGYYRTQY